MGLCLVGIVWDGTQMDGDGVRMAVRCMGMGKIYCGWDKNSADFHYRVTL